MTDTASATTNAPDPDDLAANGVFWDLDPLLGGASSVDDLLGRAEEIADRLEAERDTLASADAAGWASVMRRVEQLQDVISRAGHHAMLSFSENTMDPAAGAAMAGMQETTAQLGARVLFIDLVWAGLDDDVAEAHLSSGDLDFCKHHLANQRRYRQHLLSEPEERVLTESSVSGAPAWSRLFDELSSAIEIELPDGEGGTRTVGLEGGLSQLQHPDAEVRAAAAEAVTKGIAPGLRTRAYIFNTLLLDKSVGDRLRGYPSWVSSMNLSNEASDESVQALVDAVVSRYDIPQRWYRLKADVLGVERLADYDRMASVADSESSIGWAEGTAVVRDAYASFSDELATVVGRFIDEGWIHAPSTPGKRPGAFCAYAVPSLHPYVLLNWTGRTRDVATLAHELGHGVHGYLAREQGIFHQSTPLTLAETASVFGETVTNNRLLSMLEDPNERFALLASTLEDSIATVFRQVAMNRFEDAVHTARRTEGELSVERIGDFWAESQTAMLGDAVEITEGYRTWWSYIPHFIHTPGYVYAYAYGQLLALSVYARYQDEGDAFVPAYLELLKAGGSRSPEELGKIVGCDLADPGFWDAGLTIVEGQLDAAEAAARDAGRL